MARRTKDLKEFKFEKHSSDQRLSVIIMISGMYVYTHHTIYCVYVFNAYYIHAHTHIYIRTYTIT